MVVNPPGAAPLTIVVNAWTARWPSLSPQARAMAAAVVPGRAFGTPLAALDDLLKAGPEVTVVGRPAPVAQPALE